MTENTNMRNTLHATLAGGGYRYEYEDGSGLRCTAVKETRRSGERQFWTHDMLPDQQFATFDSVKEALDALMPDDMIWEAGKYPHIGTLSPDSCGNACRLCPRQPFTGAHIQHETWRISVMTSWQKAMHASLCANHKAEFESDPKGLLAALKAEIAARKARAQPLLQEQDIQP